MLAAFAVITGCNRDSSAHVHDEYTCPMHPTVISDKPGACPVCGMSLVKKGAANLFCINEVGHLAARHP